ncbi:hypothetical protein ACFL0M_10835 [Thermodesulfobacteriota bacterium]
MPKASIQDIFDEVESVFKGEKALARIIKMYLYQRYTGKNEEILVSISALWHPVDPRRADV